MELVTTTAYTLGLPGETPGPSEVSSGVWAEEGSQPKPSGADQILSMPHLGLLAVADALGGGRDGRAAARMALEVVRTHIERNSDLLDRFKRTPNAVLRTRVIELIGEAFARAAQEVFAFGRRREDVRVTLDVVLVLGAEAFVGHVGDGRVYLVRRGIVHQLTVDHSRGDEILEFAPMAAAGESPLPSPERTHHQRTTRTLGPKPQVRVETMCVEAGLADRFVVCAAPLHRGLPDSILHLRFTAESIHNLGGALLADAGNLPVLVACAQLGPQAPYAPSAAQALLSLLAPMPLFAHCNERELRIVAQATHPRKVAAGALLFEEGQVADELFLIISGEIAVIKNGAVIAELGPGSTLGEMGMLDEPVRSATAQAEVETEVFVITRDAFFAMLRVNPLLAVKILWNLSLRLSASLRTTSARLAAYEGDYHSS